MSIQHASERTIESLKLDKKDIIESAMVAMSKVAAAPAGQKRLDAIKENFPCLLSAAPDPRDSSFTDLVKFPYDTLQLYQQKENEKYFVVGDIHGDLESLVACTDLIIEECTKANADGRFVTPVLVVLGDLIDRGPDSAECIAFLLRLALGKDEHRKELRILLVRGDHDVALRCLPDGRISATVQPAEFAESFSSAEMREVKSTMIDAALAKCYMYFVRYCSPAAALFSNGILLSHGAVPHTDLTNRFGMDLTPWVAPCAQDFVWARMCPEYRRRGPNRSTKTTDMGKEDFCEFITTFNKLAIFQQTNGTSNVEPVSVFIHGHQHCESGYAKTQIEVPSLGQFEIHNVTTFADRDSAGRIKTPPVLLELDGRSIKPFCVEIESSQEKMETNMPSPVINGESGQNDFDSNPAPLSVGANSVEGVQGMQTEESANVKSIDIAQRIIQPIRSIF